MFETTCQYLRGIIEGSHDLIAALDLNFKFTVFNRAYSQEFEDILGSQIEVGTSIVDALAHLPQEQANAVEIWGRALQGEEFTVIQEFGDENRARKYYEITYSSIKNENNELIGLQIQLIDDLLDISRILRGKLILNTNPVDLTTVINAALETVRTVAQIKALRIETSIDINVGQVLGDFNRLQQVVTNLLTNAVKFTPSGGTIQVSLSSYSPLNNGQGNPAPTHSLLNNGQGNPAPTHFPSYAQISY